jgi:hypothetical protein
MRIMLRRHASFLPGGFALPLLTLVLVFGHAATGCGSSDKGDQTALADGGSPGATQSLPFPASAEATAALGVSLWRVSRPSSLTFLIDGLDPAGELRQQFSIELQKGASGAGDIVVLSRIAPSSARFRAQVKDEQGVVLSNEFLSDSDARQALKFLSADVQTAAQNANGLTSAKTTSTHPLDLLSGDYCPLVRNGGFFVSLALVVGGVTACAETAGGGCFVAIEAGGGLFGVTLLGTLMLCDGGE